MTTTRTLTFVLSALCLVLIPLISMVLNVGGFDWEVSEFVILAVLLTGAGVALAAGTNPHYPLKLRILGLGLLGLLLVLYVHMAVGLVDTWPLAGN